MLADDCSKKKDLGSSDQGLRLSNQMEQISDSDNKILHFKRAKFGKLLELIDKVRWIAECGQ